MDTLSNLFSPAFWEDPEKLFVVHFSLISEQLLSLRAATGSLEQSFRGVTERYVRLWPDTPVAEALLQVVGQVEEGKTIGGALRTVGASLQNHNLRHLFRIFADSSEHDAECIRQVRTLTAQARVMYEAEKGLRPSFHALAALTPWTKKRREILIAELCMVIDCICIRMKKGDHPLLVLQELLPALEPSGLLFQHLCFLEERIRSDQEMAEELRKRLSCRSYPELILFSQVLEFYLCKGGAVSESLYLLKQSLG